MRVKQRLAALAALALIVGAGCSSSSSSTTSSATTGPSGETRTVQVDGTPPNYVGAYLAFFPNAVTVHAGDTVSFKENWTGEPHTVTMGTLVETGLAAAGKADPNGPPPPEFASLPTMAPHGPGDFNQNGGQPCFLDTGAPPASAACPKASQPDFNGKQVYYNSGFLAKDATFSVKLAADIAPGTYHYYCNIHGPPMSGQIVVAPAATAIPAQDAVDAAGKTQRDAITAPLAAAETAAKAGKTNVAGVSDPKVPAGQVNEFLPGVIHARVGQKVQWSIDGVHTISFGEPATPAPFIQVAPDGSVHLNPDEAAPNPPPPAGKAPAPPANGPPPAQHIDTGRWDGTGIRSSGFVPSVGPAPDTWSLSFGKAGTYNYVCLIHPGMSGQVIVA